MVSQSVIQKFRESLRGQTFSPGDAGYDVARAVPNAMIDRHPAIIARCADSDDVIACVRFAREHDLIVAVRGGGHSVAGKSVCDGGLMIDLSAMKDIRVDSAQRTVRAETGLKLGEFDRETQSFGLATTLGVVSATGIAGLTLGGGWGHLHAKYGLAIDNVIAADVVTADGRLLTASAFENQDLFWGVRGGGGNLGVVTSLEYRLHEVGQVLAGALFYPTQKAKEVLHFWREFAVTSPDELVTQGGGLNLPDGPVVFGIASILRIECREVIVIGAPGWIERQHHVWLGLEWPITEPFQRFQATLFGCEIFDHEEIGLADETFRAADTVESFGYRRPKQGGIHSGCKTDSVEPP